jgi:hypothetical protein
VSRKDTRLAGLQAAVRALKRNEHSGHAVQWTIFDLLDLIRAERKRKPKKGAK